MVGSKVATSPSPLQLDDGGFGSVENLLLQAVSTGGARLSWVLPRPDRAGADGSPAHRHPQRDHLCAAPEQPGRQRAGCAGLCLPSTWLADPRCRIKLALPWRRADAAEQLHRRGQRRPGRALPGVRAAGAVAAGLPHQLGMQLSPAAAAQGLRVPERHCGGALGAHDLRLLLRSPMGRSAVGMLASRLSAAMSVSFLPCSRWQESGPG